jgi:hypothetical protein
MPVVGVNRDRLFEALGRTYSELMEQLLWASHFSTSPCNCINLLCFCLCHEQLMKSSTSSALSMALSWTMW